MDIYLKVMAVSAAWGVALTIFNPFFEGKKRAVAAIVCMAICTLAFLVRP